MVATLLLACPSPCLPPCVSDCRTVSDRQPNVRARCAAEIAQAAREELDAATAQRKALRKSAAKQQKALLIAREQQAREAKERAEAEAREAEAKAMAEVEAKQVPEDSNLRLCLSLSASMPAPMKAAAC